MNRSGLGTRALNIELQKALNPESARRGVDRFGSRFAPGDKVMQTENNYEKEVFNGDIGVIQSLNEVDKELVIDFDGRPVAYDFAVFPAEGKAMPHKKSRMTTLNFIKMSNFYHKF